MLKQEKSTTVYGRSEVELDDGTNRTIASMSATHNDNGGMSIHVDIVSPEDFKQEKENTQEDILEFIMSQFTENPKN